MKNKGEKMAQKRWVARIFVKTGSQSKNVEVTASNQGEAMRIIKMMHEFKSFASVPKEIK